MGMFDASPNTARVKVVNQTGESLRAVTITHKYSDVYTEIHTYDTVEAGGESSSDMEVQFNTGSFTTGRDWWLVVAVAEDGAVFFSSPENFRGVIDSLEQVAPALAGVAADMATGNPVVGIAVEEAIRASDVFNTATTDGFKQHILREEDGEVSIIIHSLDRNPDGGDDQLEFSSPSGTSLTKFCIKS